MKRYLRGTVAPLLSTALLAGCVTTPATPPPPTVALPDRLADGDGVDTAAPPPAWWRLYREPALDALVRQALADNRDLAVASARLLQAQALLEENRARRRPTATLSADAGNGSTLQDQIAAAAAGSTDARTGPRFGLGTDVAWELDLFGRLRAAIDVARANELESAAQADAVRVAIAAGVTGAWLDACGEAHRIEVAEQDLALARQGRDLAMRLRAAGSGLPADVLRAEALVAQAGAAIEPLAARRHAALVELAVLTGRPPTQLSPTATACTRLPDITSALPLGDGRSLIRRRPDVRAAEQRLAAATAQIGVATADLYPRIAFDGGAAVSSPTLGGLGTRENLVWRVGPLLTWSFPDLGAARARIRRARAGQIAALAGFDAVVLAALREVNQAAADYGAARRRQQALRVAAARGADAHRLMQLRRATGAASALQALDAERGDIEAQAALAAADAEVAAAQVVLFKALGGGWE